MASERPAAAADVSRTLVALGAASGDAQLSLPSIATASGASPRAHRRIYLTGVLMAVAAIAAALAIGWWRRQPANAADPALARPAAAAPTPGTSSSLVVLPFSTITNTPDNEFFSDGLTDEVITRLAAVPSLKVISRTSAMHYKGTAAPLRQIASELGVEHVLEGSVRAAGDRLRITVQLIEAQSDTRRWTSSFDVERRNPFQVQEEIAQQVTRALEITLSDETRQQMLRRGTRDAEAYDLYRRGRIHWLRRTREDVTRAVDYFQRAIARDSNYADAYAGLADAYLITFHNGFATVPESVSFARQRQAASRAVALDDQSADAHASMATALQWQQDWTGAECEYRRSLALNPGNTTARTWLSLLLFGTGRMTEARRESRIAADLDPFSIVNLMNAGRACYLDRDFACAESWFRRSRELNNTWGEAARTLGLALSAQGKHAEAITVMQEAVGLEPCLDCVADLALVRARAGQRSEARALLEPLTEAQHFPLHIATAWIAVGEIDRGIALLQRVDWRWPHLAARANPMLDPIRRDPRFVALSARVDTVMGVAR